MSSVAWTRAVRRDGGRGSLSKTAASDRAGGDAGRRLTATVFSSQSSRPGTRVTELPKAVLAAMMVDAVWGLIDVAAMRRYRITHGNDCVAASAAAVGVLVAGPLLGLLFAIACRSSV